MMLDGLVVSALLTFSVICTSLLLQASPASSFQSPPQRCLPPKYCLRAPTALSVVQDRRQTTNSVATGKVMLSKSRQNNRQYNVRDVSNRKDEKMRYSELERLKFQLQQVRGDLHLSEMRATAAERRVARFQAEMKDMKQRSVGDSVGASSSAGDGSRDGSTEAERKLEMRLKKRFEKQKEKLTERVRHFGDALQKLKMESQSALDDVRAAAAAEEGRLQKRISQLQSKLDATNVELKAARDESSRLGGDMETMLASARADADKEVEKVRAELAETVRIAAEERTAALAVAETELKDVRREMTDELVRAKEDAARDVEVLTAQMKRELIDVMAKARLEQDRLKRDGEQLKREIAHAKTQARLEQDRLKGEAKKAIGARDAIIQKYEGERSSIRKLVKMTLRLAGNRAVNIVRRRKKA